MKPFASIKQRDSHFQGKIEVKPFGPILALNADSSIKIS